MTKYDKHKCMICGKIIDKKEVYYDLNWVVISEEVL